MILTFRKMGQRESQQRDGKKKERDRQTVSALPSTFHRDLLSIIHAYGDEVNFDLHWGEEARRKGQFANVIAICVHQGEVFVVDGLPARVQVFSENGRYLRCIPMDRPHFDHVADLAVDEQRIYVLVRSSNTDLHDVLCFARNPPSPFLGTHPIYKGREPLSLRVYGDRLLVITEVSIDVYHISDVSLKYQHALTFQNKDITLYNCCLSKGRLFVVHHEYIYAIDLNQKVKPVKYQISYDVSLQSQSVAVLGEVVLIVDKSGRVITFDYTTGKVTSIHTLQSSPVPQKAPLHCVLFPNCARRVPSGGPKDVRPGEGKGVRVDAGQDSFFVMDANGPYLYKLR